MKRTIKVQLGKSLTNMFICLIDTEDKTSVTEGMKKYQSFFDEYKRTHNISNRRWNFPIVWFKDDCGEYYPIYKVTPNGSWVTIGN